MYKSRCSKCGGVENTIYNNERLSKVFEEFAKKVYEGDIDAGELDADFFLATGDEFVKGLSEGYPIDISNVPYNSVDVLARQQLMTNIYAFSGAKNFSQLTELRNKLVDKDGNLVSFSDFKKEAQKINAQYNVNWMKTEYDNAVNSSISAANWHRLNADKDLYPYLVYETVGDSNVRYEHQLLDGTKLPVDDPFWNTHYPPNDWGCRCDVSNSDDPNGSTTTDQALEKGKGAIRNRMFKNNPGKSGQIFKSSHPYFKSAPFDLQSLSAVDHYGLKTVEDLYSRSNKFPASIDQFKTKEAFESWWKDQLEGSSEKDLFTVNNSALENVITLNKKLKKDLLVGNDWKNAKDLVSVIKDPDEIYNKTNSSGKIITSTFLKYYNDLPVMVVTQTNSRLNITEIILTKRLKANKSADAFRVGLLMYRGL